MLQDFSHHTRGAGSLLAETGQTLQKQLHEPGQQEGTCPGSWCHFPARKSQHCGRSLSPAVPGPAVVPVPLCSTAHPVTGLVPALTPQAAAGPLPARSPLDITNLQESRVWLGAMVLQRDDTVSAPSSTSGVKSRSWQHPLLLPGCRGLFHTRFYCRAKSRCHPLPQDPSVGAVQTKVQREQALQGISSARRSLRPPQHLTRHHLMPKSQGRGWPSDGHPLLGGYLRFKNSWEEPPSSGTNSGSLKWISCC